MNVVLDLSDCCDLKNLPLLLFYSQIIFVISQVLCRFLLYYRYIKFVTVIM